MDDLSSPLSSPRSMDEKFSSAQLRKIKKPLIEKRRRERINDSLNQLKVLVLDALEKDETEYNKMEKADILEMTVQHLLHLKKRSPQPESGSGSTRRYRSGFHECVEEVKRFMGVSTVNPMVKDRLCTHLHDCMDRLSGSVSCTRAVSDLFRRSFNSSMSEFSLDSFPGDSYHAESHQTPPPKPVLLNYTPVTSSVSSSPALVPVVLQTGSGMSVLSGGRALQNGIIPLYSQPIPCPPSSTSVAQSHRSQNSHSFHRDVDSGHSVQGRSFHTKSPHHEDLTAALRLDHEHFNPFTMCTSATSRLEIQVDHAKHYSHSLPGSPVSSRGMDTPSPGSSMSERSCSSDVWRPW